MIRDVKLNSYLPDFLKNYKEIRQSLLSEDTEFVICWNAADHVFKNTFIETADEYGLSRFEKLMKILPYQEDTIESRRARVRSKWFNQIPYTLQALLQKLMNLCGGKNFKIVTQFSVYCLEIDTHLEMFGQLQQLHDILDEMIPCNVVVKVKNEIVLQPNYNLKVGVIGHIMPIMSTGRGE